MAKKGKSGGSGKGERTAAALRIIGGKFGGRKLAYTGDVRTRPMKDRLREAVFNLAGPAVQGKHAIDLFAGTGALGLEAISRGAIRATLVEQHFPTARVIRENIASLEVGDIAEVFAGDTFLWARRLPNLGTEPWIVFCSPPYDFYQSRTEAMLTLLTTLMDAAPLKSIFIVESDTEFDPALLPSPDQWDVRKYYPATVAISHKE